MTDKRKKGSKAKLAKDPKAKPAKDSKAKSAKDVVLRQLDPFVLSKPDWLFKRDNLADELLKFSEIQKLLWFSRDETPNSQNHRTMRAIDLYRGLKPIDASEGMLAVQMVAAHTTGLECMYRAANRKLTFEQRSDAIKLANKLMDLHLRQMTAFDRHRKNKLAEVVVPGWGEALFYEEMADVERNPASGAHGPLFYPTARRPFLTPKPEPKPKPEAQRPIPKKGRGRSDSGRR